MVRTAQGRFFPTLPVTGIEIYKRDVRVKRAAEGEHLGGGKRKPVTEFTKRARQNLAFVAMNTSVTFQTMVTLTYPAIFPTDGRECKAHLAAFLQWMRRTWNNPDYLWFLEWQKRGAPHFHILVARKRQRGDIQAVAAEWFRIVDSRDDKHLMAGTQTARIRKPDGAARYAVKYACKMRQKRPPQGFIWCGRLYGYSRAVKPVCQAAVEIDERSLRAILDGWEYCPPEETDLYPLLYGATTTVVRVLDTAGIDIDNHSQYV